MSNFTDKDVAKIQKWGNAEAKKYWMASHNKTLYPIPDRRDMMKMKEFMRMKYTQKRFTEENNEDDSDNDEESDESSDHKKKKKKPKKKKAKIKKKSKKKESSDEESSSETESEEEEVKEQKIKGSF